MQHAGIRWRRGARRLPVAAAITLAIVGAGTGAAPALAADVLNAVRTGCTHDDTADGDRTSNDGGGVALAHPRASATADGRDGLVAAEGEVLAGGEQQAEDCGADAEYRDSGHVVGSLPAGTPVRLVVHLDAAGGASSSASGTGGSGSGSARAQFSLTPVACEQRHEGGCDAAVAFTADAATTSYGSGPYWSSDWSWDLRSAAGAESDASDAECSAPCDSTLAGATFRVARSLVVDTHAGAAFVLQADADALGSGYGDGGAGSGDAQLSFSVTSLTDGAQLAFGGGDVPDTSPPDVTAQVSPEANVAGWHRGEQVEVALAATDDSGVAAVAHRLDGGAPTATPGASVVVPVSAEGVTDVTFWATDLAGNSSPAQSVVVRLDRTPPQLTLPAAVTASADTPSGTAVTFGATATDELDPAATVVCDPQSGSTFPAGTTEVSCTAHDAAGNTTEAAFPVTVSVPSPAQRIAALKKAVEALALSRGTDSSLQRKLAGALRHVEAARTDTARKLLVAFVNEVRAQSGKHLTTGQAAALVDHADRVLRALRDA